MFFLWFNLSVPSLVIDNKNKLFINFCKKLVKVVGKLLWCEQYQSHYVIIVCCSESSVALLSTPFVFCNKLRSATALKIIVCYAVPPKFQLAVMFILLPMWFRFLCSIYSLAEIVAAVLQPWIFIRELI